MARSWGWWHRAVIARLTARTGSNVMVTDRQPSRVPRYLQVQTGGGNRSMIDARADGVPPRDVIIPILAVGLSPDECLDALEQCDNAMIGWDGDPADPSAHEFWRVDDSPPMIADGRVEGDERFSITVTYRLRADR